MKQIICGFFFLGLLMLAAGCNGQVAKGVSVTWLVVENDDGNLDATETVTIDDIALAKKLSVVPRGFTSRLGGVVAMNILNSSASKPLNLSFRFEWLNDDGTILPYPYILWRTLELEPDSPRFLYEPVPGAAAGYRLSIRQNN